MKNLIVDCISDKLFNTIVEATANNGGLYLLIDSYGGDLQAGYKIYDYIKGRDNVYCNVIGNCMSAAVLVLLGVKKENRTANEHARFLIHRPLLDYKGQLTQKISKKVYDAIEDETQKLMKVYRKELNASDVSLFAMLDAEQVFGARQAVAMGFVSSVNTTNKDEQGEIEQSALLDIAYNQKLINKKVDMEKRTMTECLNAIKNLFGAKDLKNSKAITTADGKDINVETDGDVEKGNKCDAPDGSYVLGDNRTIVVKDGVIESIEQPANENENDDPEKKQEENGDDKEKVELMEKVKNLTESETELKNELETAKAELESLKNVKSKMDEFEKVNKLIDDAGGISAVLNAVSHEPNRKSDDAKKKDVNTDDVNEVYSFVKNLG